MTWTIVQETEPDLALRKVILDVLIAHTATAAGDWNWQPLAITVRNDAGVIAGGL